jgi:hypothetical protein
VKHAAETLLHGLLLRALDPYMIDKLRTTELTYKEMQLRMADPEVHMG